MGEVGRPRRFDSAEEMQEAIDKYFAKCDEEDRPYTVTGLAYALGTTRKTLLDYQNKYEEEFCNTINRAKTKIEMYAEEQLYRTKGSVNGVKFNLTNNFNWQDKQVQQLEGDTEINVTLKDE